jgi:hypothetical protein
MPLRPRAHGLWNNQPPDSYVGLIVKYIPAEVVAAYQTGAKLIESGLSESAAQLPVYWTWAGVLLIASYFWIRFATRIPGDVPAHRQAIGAPLAFAVWVYALGGPFVLQFPGAPSEIAATGSLLLILTTLLLPLLERVPIFPKPPAIR